MNKVPAFVLFVMLSVLLCVALWTISRPTPVYTKTESDLDNTIIGDSATDDHNDGPAYMGANWAWPMPLAFWNPINSVSN